MLKKKLRSTETKEIINVPKIHKCIFLQILYELYKCTKTIPKKLPYLSDKERPYNTIHLLTKFKTLCIYCI